MPFFLKPGVLKWDVFNSNLIMVVGSFGQNPTTRKQQIGFTIHLLFMDEFAIYLKTL